MLNSNSTRVFLIFSVLILICFGGLSSFFINESLKREEVYLQDLLSSRSLLSASELEASLNRNQQQSIYNRDPKAIDAFENYLRKMEMSVVIDDPIAGPRILGHFKDLASPSLLNQSLPAAGTIVSRCELNNIAGRCSFTYMDSTHSWLFDFLPQSQFVYVFRQYMLSLLPYLLAMLALTAGLSYLFARAINAPLKRFVKAAEIISEGNYTDLRLKEKEVVEFERLRSSFLSMVQSIQDREERIKRAGAQLAHSERLATIGQLGASIAHELKNPMMAMKGYAKVLIAKATAQEEQEAAQIISAEVARCENILQQMLRFSRRESEKKVYYAVHEVIESTCMLLKSEAKNRRIRFRKKLSQENDHLYGHPQQLQQVLMNLLMNAIQASPEGSEIFIESLCRDSEIEISVRDCGQGIPPENRGRIFEAFFTTKEPGEGSGLGLSIVNDIVRAQGGRVEFQSEPGQGTRFQLYLPLAKQAA